MQGPVFLGPADLRRLFVPDALMPLLRRLTTFATGAESLLLVTGEPGSGKSTIARWLYESLPQDTHDVLLTAMVQRETTGGWLTPRLAELLGATNDLRDIAARLDDLIAEERRLVVIIDAAHLASTPDALGEIAGLLNLQALAGACLSFVLIGDPSLVQTTQATPDLKAKVSLSLSLPLLTVTETGHYLTSRAAQHGLKSPFDGAAVQLIHQKSRGLMAHVSTLAEHCLIEAAECQMLHVTAEVVSQAALHAGGPAPVEGRRLAATQPHISMPTTAAGTETVAIKLTSLFKSEPGRQKP